MVKKIILTQGYVALVDDEDYERVAAAASWHSTPPRGDRVYAQRHVRRPDGRKTTQKLHQFLTGWSEVDHRDGDGLNNQRRNLRSVTRTQNNANARLRRDSSSGFKGVSWQKRDRNWYARISAEKRCRFLGCFGTPEAAARAYDAAAREIHGEFARLNFPEASAA